ncbi:hypothetical protein BTVI_00857 [Pitangus sulphuratus]|nr:hypothetical protein BTVI_00857 [Pitangus sulphuratus]
MDINGDPLPPLKSSNSNPNLTPKLTPKFNKRRVTFATLPTTPSGPRRDFEHPTQNEFRLKHHNNRTQLTPYCKFHLYPTQPSISLNNNEEVIPVSPKEPLPNHSPYLLITSEEAVQKGVIALHDVIDNADSVTQIHVTVFIPFPPVELTSEDSVAALLSLPPYQSPEGERGGVQANWTYTVEEQQLTMVVTVTSPEGEINISGLLDTGADVTIIAKKVWPDYWPLENTVLNVSGVGGSQRPLRSKLVIMFTDIDGNVATCQPLILPLPATLSGRDLMAQWATTLNSNF